MRRARERTRERGAAAVEFAVVLPLLVMIVCATIDFGYYFFTREIVINASREGARVGSLQLSPGADVETEVTAAASTYLDAASLDPAKAHIVVGGDGCPADASCVRITYDIAGNLTGFLGWPGVGYALPTTIVAYAQMRK